MTPDQKAVVQQTWQKVVPIADTAATLFYDRLFTLDPEARSLFAGADMASQRRKLVLSLSQVIDALDKVQEVVPDIQAMGRRHAYYGVKDAHYDSVGAALLWTLEQGLGTDWNEDAKDAWSAAYALIADTMKAAAAAADATQPA